jgi:3-oxoacyl-[acyl-carrier protein] reductase
MNPDSSASFPTAIITGGGTGVGRATVLELARRGYAVAVVYSRSRTEAEATVAEVLALGGRAVAIRADVAVDADCRAMVAQVVAALGRVDVLVNCAGTTEFIPFEDLDRVEDGTWDRLFHVNVLGAFHCARAVRAAMLASGGGQIINVSSIAAQLGQGSSIPYCASKAALDSVTVSMARTLAPQIRVNGVAPGFITGRWLEGGLGANYEAVKQSFEKSLPLGRVCEPADVAACIVSLITGSQLVTGQTLVVDAGMMIAGFQARVS